MKKTILATFILLLLSGCNNSYTAIDEQNKKIESNNLDLQEKCSKNAQIFFDYFENDSPTKQTDEFRSHYNVKFNKCFVLVKHGITNVNDTYGEYLYDAIEKKQYGSFAVGIPTHQTPLICELLDKYCKTRDEFDSFVKSYMEE